MLCLVAALASAGSAAASLEPLRRSFGELTVPRVRAGTMKATAAGRPNRIRVIVALGLPPLAATDARRLASGRPGAVRKLSVSSASSRAYLARIDAAQRKAIVLIQRSIPEARTSRRFRIVVNGLTVSLPVRRLPALLRLGFVRKVYPSLRYARTLNVGPAIIGAPALQALTGARGDGVKVAIVDDGIDQANPFFDPAGYQYPAGFPKGVEQFTNAKVIAARAFPGPGSGAAGRRPLDRANSFHGTHVGGVVAGNAGTTAPDSRIPPEGETRPSCNVSAGGCHPEVPGLSGVAPRAWLGNYRVFNVPSPLSPDQCCSAGTPEIVAAFEAAVADGMDVINFSGGGPQIDPASDALIETVQNVVRAGVVPVISAGNDRGLFGLGSVGSPSTAPDAISVAAVSNAHVFGRALSVVSPDVPDLRQIPFVPTPGGLPDSWAVSDQVLVDVGAIAGTDGRLVDRQLCGPGNPNDPQATTLPARSLQDRIALVSRGGCTFGSKAARAGAAGAAGLVIADNRPGEANGIGFRLGLPAGMISDRDGTRLREEMARTGGRAAIRVGRDEVEVGTNRSATVTSFSAGGPTAFGHDLKPDVAAPGAQVLSATVDEFAGAQFASLDGTSFSAPHVSGAVALLLQRHPSWSPKQVKSALMLTAGPAFEDTARTREASVYLQGAGLVRVTVADDPRVFSDPQSLSFRDLNVTAGAASRALLVTLSDAGGGAGTWEVALQPQSASAGAAVEVGSQVALAPGGQSTFQVVARASGDAVPGENTGFVILRQGGITRRIPYGFSVTRPRLAGAEPIQLRPLQSGNTSTGVDRAREYRWPTAPYGVTGELGVDRPIDEDGKEQVYFFDIDRRAVNFGVAVVEPSPDVRSPIQSLLSAPIHPWLLGSQDENDVQGYAGTPVNVNSLMPDFLFDISAAGTVFAQPKRYYVSVDSGRDPFTGRSLAGPYVLRSWLNDTRPPRIQLLTTRVATGHPTLVLRATDTQAGVDPLSVTVDYSRFLVGASLFDTKTGIAVVPLPRETTELRAGRVSIRLIASDYQEAKNVYTEGQNPLPNSRIQRVRLRVIRGATVAWLTPGARACVPASAELSVAGSSSALISSVGFFDGRRQIARVRRNVAGIFTTTWRTDRARKGKHVLTAVVSDTAGREARATRTVRVCRA